MPSATLLLWGLAGGGLVLAWSAFSALHQKHWEKTHCTCRFWTCALHSPGGRR